MGEVKMTTWIDGIVKAIRAVKANEESLKLQNNFSRRPSIPGHTPLAGQFLTIQRTKTRKGREPSFIPNPLACDITWVTLAEVGAGATLRIGRKISCLQGES